MKQNSGCVIGGPEIHRGTYHRIAGELLKLPLPFDTMPLEPSAIPSKFDGYTVAEYKFVEMQWRHSDPFFLDRNFGFWVPIKEKYQQPFILDTLLENYIENNVGNFSI